MKKINLVFIFLIMGIILPSCEKESPSIEILDSSVLREQLKNQTIEMYNYRQAQQSVTNNDTRSRSSLGNDFILTDDEKQVLAQTALNLLLSYGLTEAEINADLGGITDEKLITVAFSIIDIEEQASRGIELIDRADNISLLTGELVALPEILPQSQVYDCLLQAAGITVLTDLIKKGIKGLTKAAIKTLLTKVATKYLGYVGAAIAVYEFGDCMDWW
jgi:hypothetical protein